jgi:hypothetical protein
LTAIGHIPWQFVPVYKYHLHPQVYSILYNEHDAIPQCEYLYGLGFLGLFKE